MLGSSTRLATARGLVGLALIDLQKLKLHSLTSVLLIGNLRSCLSCGVNELMHLRWSVRELNLVRELFDLELRHGGAECLI